VDFVCVGAESRRGDGGVDGGVVLRIAVMYV
jgi:hypothetical protein